MRRAFRLAGAISSVAQTMYPSSHRFPGKGLTISPNQAARASAEEPSWSIGGFTVTALPGNRVATMFRACWRLRACTATAKRAAPERTSIEIVAIWITHLLSPLITFFSQGSVAPLTHTLPREEPAHRRVWVVERLLTTGTSKTLVRPADSYDQPACRTANLHCRHPLLWRFSCCRSPITLCSTCPGDIERK